MPPPNPSRSPGTALIPANRVMAFFSNPFGNLDAARNGAAEDRKRPDYARSEPQNGWLVAITLYLFRCILCVGPGVCVWLALSELMPTRIRSNGMSIALLINQGVSTTIAAIFLPTVGKYGYATMFFAFAACHRHLFRDRGVFPAGNQGQNPGRNRSSFRGRESVVAFFTT